MMQSLIGRILILLLLTHARNRVTRRSHTRILLYLNTAPILWCSKAQTTVESSTFSSEFVAMHIAVDLSKMRQHLELVKSTRLKNISTVEQ